MGTKANYRKIHDFETVLEDDLDKKEYTFNAVCPVPKEVEEIGYSGNYREFKLREIFEKHNIPFTLEKKFRYINANLTTERKTLGSIIVRKDLQFPGYEDKYSEMIQSIYNKLGENNEEELKVALDLVHSILFKEDGYYWQIKNWGTKWSPEIVIDEKELIRLKNEKNNETSLMLYFDTAWSPPNRFFENVSPKYPELVFVNDYEEPGCAFKGTFEIQNGEIINDDCYNYCSFEEEEEEEITQEE